MNFEKNLIPKQEKKEKDSNVFRNSILGLVVATVTLLGADYVKNNTAEAQQEKELKEKNTLHISDYQSLRKPGSNEGFGDIRIKIPEGYSKVIKNNDTLMVGSERYVEMDIITDNVKAIEDSTGIAKTIDTNK